MAAILPHLAVLEDNTEIERAFDVCTGNLNGLGEGEICPSPAAVLADAHAGLLGMLFVREAVEQSLAGRSFVAQAGDVKGRLKNLVYLVLDGEVGPGPAWNPVASPTATQYELLSWTSKMNAPSWSIPAGASQIGGSCPGAAAGQSVVPEVARTGGVTSRGGGAVGLVNFALKRPADHPVDLAKAICARCYATGGQYSTGHVQVAQALRYYWAKQAVELGTFVDTMVYAVDNADYQLEAYDIKKKGKVVARIPAERGRRRFFRIHDSGDFFSEEYLMQWCQVADRLKDITFWAPSRIWATSWGIEAVNRLNSGRENLIIRPSAYEIDDSPPVDLGPGWAAGTTVLAATNNEGMGPKLEQYVEALERKGAAPRTGKDPRYDWDCRAYAADDDGHTCRNAVAPPASLGGPGGAGCRACWTVPSKIVNYSLH